MGKRVDDSSKRSGRAWLLDGSTPDDGITKSEIDSSKRSWHAWFMGGSKNDAEAEDFGQLLRFDLQQSHWGNPPSTSGQGPVDDAIDFINTFGQKRSPANSGNAAHSESEPLRRAG